MTKKSKKTPTDDVSTIKSHEFANVDSRFNPDELIFALDIGTRTVMGVVGIPQADRYHILAVDVVEHGGRAMMDGQIHDIAKVCQVVNQVKENLEIKLGFELTKVSVAAAGRVLLTSQVKVEREIEEGHEIDNAVINALDMEGIQKAQTYLETEVLKSERSLFYCVGYTVTCYYLNDFPITELLGHKGYKISADILATFLPHVVVDSLYTVMDRVGLEVENLTLEPIAAINIAIPKELRLLNLALVDVGAGTSDIALTHGGTVSAYAMVPIAGDEVTEAIAEHYLVEFSMGEKIKLSMKNRETPITFTDIFENETTVSYDEVLQCIQPVTRHLASSIAGKIMELNGGKPPHAVFLVGGGSRTPALCESLSDSLGLPKERVAVRNRSIAKSILYEGEDMAGPECITPFGILITSAIQRGHDFFHVTVNGKKVKLFNSRKMTVSDALILLGYTPDQLIGKKGKSLKFTLNGQPKTIRGSFGSPAEIRVNESNANLGTHLHIGDNITLKEAINGQDAVVKAGDFRHTLSPLSVQINDETYNMPQKLFLNGNRVEPDSLVRENDDLQISCSYTLSEISAFFEIDSDEYIILVDNTERVSDDTVDSNHYIKLEKKSDVKEIKKEVESDFFIEKEEPVETEILQGLNKERAQPLQEGIYITVNGNKTFLGNSKKSYMFVDIFNYIDFDISKPQGTIVLKLNGSKAGFTDPIQAGDSIEIYWEK